MPRADFRLDGDVLDPRAPVKVVAVMCHPSDAHGRESILRLPPPKVIVPRHREPPRAADGMGSGELWEHFVLHRHVAALAGILTLALAQVSAFGQRGAPQPVLAIAATILTAWLHVVDRAAETKARRQADKDEEQFVNAFHRYRSASHLWAAVVYGVIQGRPNLHPLSLGQLPSFLAYAEEIARLATSLDWHSPDELALAADELWTFILPAKVARKAEALPLMRPSEEGPAPEEADISRPPS